MYVSIVIHQTPPDARQSPNNSYIMESEYNQKYQELELGKLKVRVDKLI